MKYVVTWDAAIFSIDDKREDALREMEILLEREMPTQDEIELWTVSEIEKAETLFPPSVEPLDPSLIIYGVEWIEVEFGQRPEGWRLFLDKRVCIDSTKESSEKGADVHGYLGPVRPLRYYEIPAMSIDDPAVIRQLREQRTAFTDNFWSPKFRDTGHSIK